MARLCTEITKRSQKPCPNREGFFGLPFGSDGKCPAHTSDPELRQRFNAVRAKGNKVRVAPDAPQTLGDAAALAAWAARQVAAGKMSKDDAAALRDLLREFRELLGARDADAKLAEARRVLEEMKAAKGGHKA